MQKNTIVRRLAGFAAVIAFGVPLVGCADAPPEQGTDSTTKSFKQLQTEAEALARKGAVYEGDPWEARFREQHDLDELAAGNLLAYLDEEREVSGALPTDRRIVLQRFRDELGDWRLVLLTPFGARIHAP